MEGTPFGRYHLIELLGRGGMGEVWRAHDTDTDRIVAIKLLPANLSEDKDFQLRFRREAHAAARLNSPHIIPIHHYGEIDGRLYVDMRLVEGRDLATVLSNGQLELPRAVRIIEQVAKALHAAHRVGLLHRDIKPSNILLDADDFAYLIDFGIARVLDDTRMTKSGNTIGTFQYIAPERMDGVEDARADIYSLACVFYECLTGHPPFDLDTMPRLVDAHLHTPPPRPSITREDVPPAVDEVIATGMAKDPDERYATTVELAKAARDAISEPVERPVSSPVLLRSTESVVAPAGVIAQPATIKAESPTTAKPSRPASAPAVPSTTGGISRNAKIALVAGAVAVVAVIAGAVGIPALTNNQPAPSLPSSSSTPTSSERSYGAQVQLPFTDLGINLAVAVDTNGTVYVADQDNHRVLRLPAGAIAPTEVLTGLEDPSGVAVDTASNLYVTDSSSKHVLKLLAGAATASVLPFDDLQRPGAVAVDTAGNVYLADNGDRVLKFSVAATTPQILPFAGLHHANGVAVDATGNVYVADWDSSGASNLGGNNQVLKLPVGASTPTVLPFNDPRGLPAVAVDTTGNAYVTDTSGIVSKLPAGATTSINLPFSGPYNFNSVAVDAAGNIYVATTNHVMFKLPVE